MNWKAKSPRAITLPTSWQQLQQGEHYCNALTQYFADWLPKILGYQILKIGGLSGEIECDLPLRHQMVLAPKITENLTALSRRSDHSLMQANLTELPFIQQSIDACLLANTLNFCPDPHQLLREVRRVMTDDGYLFISLFNPISKLLFKRNLNKRQAEKLTFRLFLNYRIIDWLELLHFEVLQQQNLPSGIFSPLTVIVARKRTYPLILTPQKVRFNSNEIFKPIEAFKHLNPTAEKNWTQAILFYFKK